jgi:hypothetical protein
VESGSNKKQLAEIEQKILEVRPGNNNILTDKTAVLGGTQTYFKITTKTIK